METKHLIIIQLHCYNASRKVQHLFGTCFLNINHRRYLHLAALYWFLGIFNMDPVTVLKRMNPKHQTLM